MHRRVRGSYAVVVLIAGHGVLAFRDPFGIRPLSRWAAATNGTVMVASESVALEGTGHTFERHVAPGEAVFIDLEGKVHAQQCAERPSSIPCIFEYVYLARPDSVMDGISVYQARLNLGETLAKRVVSTVPPERDRRRDPDPRIEPPERDAAGAAAGHPVPRRLRQEPLCGPHLHHAGAGRAQEVRAPEAQRRSRSEFKGRNVLLVDDSIVRGTTSREIVQMARDAGARKVYMASAAPPVRFPNVYGIDMPTAERAGGARPHGGGGARDHRLRRADLPGRGRHEDARSARSTRKLDGFDASCFDGVYVTGDINADDITRINAARVGQEDPLEEDTSRLALPNAQDA